MLYDLADAPPTPGSLLESLFLIVTKRRQEVDFLQTRLLIAAIREPNVEKSDIQESFKEYLEAMFPYLEGKQTQEHTDAKTMLQKWADVGPLSVKPIWRATDNKGLVSKLRRGAEKILQSEKQRQTHKHRRI